MILKDKIRPLADRMRPKSLLDFFGPVSYTHLRAHENVLDLVCRLLPEKKKQQFKRHTLKPNLTLQQSFLSS